MMTTLRNVRFFPRTTHAEAVDIEIENGHFASFTTTTSAETIDRTGADVIEGAGRALLPSLGDVHAHLDSNRMGQIFRPHTPDGTLHGFIMNDRENWRSGERNVRDQAAYVIAKIVSSGGTRIRSHTQIDADCGLERFIGVRGALADHSSILDSQIVALPQAGIVAEKGVRDLLDAALSEGADLVGGLDPLLYDRDPVAHLNVVFGLAEKHGKGIDIHLHERGSAGVFTVEKIAHRITSLSCA